MSKNFLLGLVILWLPTGLLARAYELTIAKGTVLQYEVKQGGKSLLYTVTIQNWDEDAAIAFSWQTNEKPNPRNGSFTLDKYYDLSSEVFFVGIGTAGNRQFTSVESCILAPSVLQDILYGIEEDNPKFTIDENGVKHEISTSDAEIIDEQEKPLKYNGQPSAGLYTHIVNGAKTLELGLLYDPETDKYLLAYYRSAKMEMNLLSVSTKATVSPKPAPAANAAPAKKATAKTMDPAKLAAVKKAYPVLATLEAYDVTKGGKEEKPFSETYDFREATGAANPPSAVDCFTADLKIIFKLRKNYGLSAMTEVVEKNTLPASAAVKLINVYLTNQATKIPGYKPWTHHQFVQTLSASQLAQLAKDLEGYIKQYGFSE